MVEARQDMDDVQSQSSSCPSEYSGSISDQEGYEPNEKCKVLYVGSLPRSEEQVNEELREQFCKEMEKFREE